MFKFSLICAALLGLAACSSAVKPVTPDGGSRVPANDAVRISALQDRVAGDRQLLSENNLLKAQVNVLSQKLNEMTNIVREALVLPPAAPPPAARPLSPVPSPISGQSSPSTLSPVAQAELMSSQSLKREKDGVIIRVFHPFAKTGFEPSESVADVLRESARQSSSVEVRGMTDANNINPIDKMIAMERAEKARMWLVDNGVNPQKIRLRYFSAGQHLANNKTEAGRALNRRVEIDMKLNGVVAGL